MGRESSTHGRDENEFKILVRKSEGKRPFRRPRYGWKDNIGMDLRETGR